MKRILMLLVGAALLLGLAQPLRKGLVRQMGSNWQQESMTYLPKNGDIRSAFLGFETTVAHYLWIKAILYFGGHRMTDQTYPWLIDMMDIITRLCPWFYPAYEFGGLMIPDLCDNPEAGRIILERGMTYLGDKRWNIGFYLGMIYYKYYGNRKMAAECFARAAMVKSDQQTKLLAMANAFYTKSGSPEEGLAFLVFTYNTSENPEVRAYLLEKIKEIQARQQQSE